MKEGDTKAFGVGPRQAGHHDLDQLLEEEKEDEAGLKPPEERGESGIPKPAG